MTENRVNFQPVRSSPLYSTYKNAVSTFSLSITTKKKAKTNWKTQPSRLRPYLIGDQIGGNEMSKIFSAIHCINYCPAAIKMIPLRKLQKAFAYGQQIMHAESILAPLLCHPHITPIYETIYSETHLMQIMQLLENGNLYCLLAQIAETKYEQQMNQQALLEQSPLQQNIENEKQNNSYENSNENINEDELADYEIPYSQKIIYVDQILSAIEYLHSHFICHRDIKLDNVLLDKNMANVKICDFGFSAISLPSKPVSGLFGSAGYAAPEIIENKRPYDGIAADMWSLGVLIFVIFAERFPYEIEQDDDQAEQENEQEDTESESNYNLGEIEKQSSFIQSTCSCSSISSRNGSILHNNTSSDFFNVISYFEDAIKEIDYTGIPDEIISIIKSLLVIDPKKRPSCHQIRQNPVFDSIQHRVINQINDIQENNNHNNIKEQQFRIKLEPISEKEALKVIVIKIAELKKMPITKVMANLKSPDENEDKILYRLIKNVIEFEGYLSSPNSIYKEIYEQPLSSNIVSKNNQQQNNSSLIDKEVGIEKNKFIHFDEAQVKNNILSEKDFINTKDKRRTRNRRNKSINAKHSNCFQIFRSNSFSTLKNIIEENFAENANNSLLANSFKTIEEFKLSEIVTVFGDPAKIMNDIDNYLIKNHYSVSCNVIGERKAVALSEEDETIIITIEIGKNNCDLDPMLYYDVKLVSKTGKREDFEDVSFFIKSRFSLPIFDNN